MYDIAQPAAAPAVRPPAVPGFAAPGGAPVTAMAPVFAHRSYMIRRKVLKILGGAFHVFDSTGQVVGYTKQKAFKLKEDLRLFTDESMQKELLVIQARQVIDWGASYDVFDPATQQKVGALRRRGWKSMLKDEWIILDAFDREIGLIQEQGTVLA